MTCQRCIGLMVPEQVWDECRAMYTPMFYCVNCGGITDRTILRHQQAQRPADVVLAPR